MLVKTITDVKLDIIGDIHGELSALYTLLQDMGYNVETGHPDGRKLVFAGDFVDRGPQSVSTLYLVKSLVERGIAYAIAGNHELNFLKKDYHEGTGWSYFAHMPRESKFEPYERLDFDYDNVEDLHQFVDHLPLMLKTPQGIVVHAAWTAELEEALVHCPHQTILAAYQYFAQKIEEDPAYQAAKSRRIAWLRVFDETNPATPPQLGQMSEELMDFAFRKEMGNPVINVLCGTLLPCAENPFYVGGKWRFIRRFGWWDNHHDDVQVIIGHFWRRIDDVVDQCSEDYLFSNIPARAWLGPRQNVYCVDYSVGLRYADRLIAQDAVRLVHTTTLGGLRLPENLLFIENKALSCHREDIAGLRLATLV